MKDSGSSDVVIAKDTTFVVLVNPIQSKDDATVKTEIYTETLTFSDTVRPTVSTVKYPKAGTAEIHFSEELSATGTVTVLDGTTDVTGDVTIAAFTAGDDMVEISGLTANKEYTVKMVGAKDWSNNLISPNPASITIKSTIVDEVKPEVASIKATGADSLEVKFSEGLKAVGSNTWDKYADITVGGTALDGGTQTFDADTNTLTVTGMTVVTSTPVTAGIESVKLSGYQDYAGNTGDDYTKAVEFKAYAPALEKTEVKDIAGTKTLVLTFDKTMDNTAANGASGTGTGTYITPEGVEKTVTVVAGDITATGKELHIDVSAYEAGDYTVELNAAGISDGTTARSTDLEVEFTVTAAADTEKAAIANVYVTGEDASSDVTGVTSVARNTMYVKYDKKMGSSAINKSNYSIEGVAGAIKSAVFVGDTTVVKLTLEDDKVTLGGDYSLAINSNVKGENGVAIDAATETITLVENVRPTLLSAKVIDATTVRVTFSEAMDTTELVQAAAGDDFKVTVNGVADTITDVSAVTGNKSFDITLSGGLSDLSSDVVKVELLEDTDAQDAQGNPVRAPKVIDVEL